MNDLLMSVLKGQFLKFIERYIAAPVTVVLVSHNLVSSNNANTITQALAEIFGWSFIILVYHYTHQQGNNTIVNQSEKQSIWQWIMGKLLVPKQSTSVTPAATSTEATQTLP